MANENDKFITLDNLATFKEEYDKSLDSGLEAKQDVLVSGENIKTINHQSLLGSGNITIQGGEGGNAIFTVTPEEFDDNVLVLSNDDVDYIFENKPAVLCLDLEEYQLYALISYSEENIIEYNAFSIENGNILQVYKIIIHPDYETAIERSDIGEEDILEFNGTAIENPTNLADIWEKQPKLIHIYLNIGNRHTDYWLTKTYFFNRAGYPAKLIYLTFSPDTIKSYTFTNQSDTITLEVNDYDFGEYVTYDALSEELEPIMEAAEGKCKTTIIDDSLDISYVKDPIHQQLYVEYKGEDITQDVLDGVWDTETFVNTLFNSNNNYVDIPDEYIIFEKAQDEFEFMDVSALDFKKGDIILVTQIDVPDRWLSGLVSSNLRFYKMETSKIDLTNVAWTNQENLFTRNQTVEGDVLVSNGTTYNDELIGLTIHNTGWVSYISQYGGFEFGMDSTSIYPTSTNKKNLGNTNENGAHYWDNAYINSIYTRNANTNKKWNIFESDNGTINFAIDNNTGSYVNMFAVQYGSFVPLASGKDLGYNGTTQRWHDIYLKGKIDFGTNISNRTTTCYIDTDSDDGMRFYCNNIKVMSLYDDGIYCDYKVIPNVTDTTDLGSSTKKWRNIYMSGSLRDGNNSDYGLVLPDTTSWTANKTIATTDQLGGGITITTTAGSESIGDGTNTLNVATRNTDQIITGSKTFSGYNLLRVSNAGWSYSWYLNYNARALELKEGSSSSPTTHYVFNRSTGFYPATSGSKSLGTESAAWTGLYLNKNNGNYVWSITHNSSDNNVEIGVKATGGSMTAQYNFTQSALRPSANNSKDLGSASYKWKDLYLSGNLSDGTKSVSVADIAQKGTTLIGTGTFSNGSFTLASSLFANDGLYLFTYGNCSAFIAITSTMLSSSYPIRTCMPVIYDNQGSCRTGILGLSDDGTNVTISLFDNTGAHVYDGFQMTVLLTKLY